MVHHRKWNISMQFNIGQESIFIKQDKLDIWDTQVTDLAFRIMQKEPES